MRDARSLEIAPHLWSGVGLVRGGAGTALVGSHSEVADRIAEYAEVGKNKFIFSGYPHLEELYWFGGGVWCRFCGSVDSSPARAVLLRRRRFRSSAQRGEPTPVSDGDNQM